MRRQNVFFFLELPIAVMVTLFIAGVAMPSRVRSDKATQKAMEAGALHTISVGGMGFSYTNENLGYAMLGALVGAAGAVMIHIQAPSSKRAISTRMAALRVAVLRH
jgi:hypothetical protein